jgi:3-hydroxyacyl-CoA dehydrogenase/enoyl-CoA hydratase/carnithine racemase
MHPMIRLEWTADHIALATLDQPDSKVNILSQPMWGELEQMLTQLHARAETAGLLLASAKPGIFVAGADLNELGKAGPVDPATTRALVARGLAVLAGLEALPFPTVALIDGACLGGGLELALACDARLLGSHPRAELGFPEVKIGLIPGWGGTQRLPRLIGPIAALDLILSAEPIRAPRAVELGLAHATVPSEQLLARGQQLLRELAASDAWRAARQRKQAALLMSADERDFAFSTYQAQHAHRLKLPAPQAALTVIAQGIAQPLAEALHIESEAFVRLAGSDISRNLIAVFFATQKVQKLPLPAAPAEIKQVGVVGAGTMGAGIAAACLSRGIPTYLTDQNPATLQAAAAQLAGPLQTGHELAPLGQCDCIIEAIVEDRQAKAGLYRQIADLLKPTALLVSNTSTIPIAQLAEAVARPAAFAGLHFFNPVAKMQLVEVVRGPATDDATIATLTAFVRRLGKTAVIVGDGPGFLVNRVLFPYLDEALLLAEAGVAVAQIDAAAVDFGMPIGPLQLCDLIGLDVVAHCRAQLHAAFADRAVPSQTLQRLLAAGRRGVKSGAGFYAYPKGTRPVADPDTPTLIGVHPASAESVPNLTDRLILPMFTEACRALGDGIVASADELDVAMILGTGFPAWRGGLIRWGRTQGYAALAERLGQLAHLGPRYTLTPAVEACLRGG